MEIRRSYNEFCGLAKALDVVGDRWTLLLARTLLLGPQRFCELKRGMPGMTPNLLSKRLRENEALGLIERVPMRPGLRTLMYQLTPLGWELEPVIHALGRWGQHWMDAPAPSDHHNLEWLLVALRRRYKGGKTLRAELVTDDQHYYLLLSESRVEIGRGRARPVDLRIKGSEEAIAQLFLKPFTEESLEDLTVLGIDPQVELLLDSFHKGEAPIALTAEAESTAREDVAAME